MKDTCDLFSKKLRDKRKEQHLSMQKLADLAGISKSLISKIEKKQVFPTIKTASQIAVALKSSLTEMFLEENTNKVIYYPAEKQLEINESGYIRRFMSPSTHKSCVEIFYERLAKGCSTKTDSYAEADKYIIALDDGLSITAAGKVYPLKKGDSLNITRQVEHNLINKSDKEIPFIIVIHHKHDMA